MGYLRCLLLYRCNIPKQHYDFFNKPDADDLKWLSETHSNSTYSVRTVTPACPTPLLPIPDPPNGGGSGKEGPSGGLSPQSVTPVAASQAVQPSDKGGKGFNIRTLTGKIKSIVRKKFLPNFPAFATLLLTVLLLAKPAQSADLAGQNMSAFVSFVPGKARTSGAQSVSMTQTSSQDQFLTPLSAATTAVLTRKQSFLLSLHALSAAGQLLTNPQFLKTYHVDVSDDPDSKALLSYLQCETCQKRSRRCHGSTQHPQCKSWQSWKPSESVLQ